MGLRKSHVVALVVVAAVAAGAVAVNVAARADGAAPGGARGRNAPGGTVVSVRTMELAETTLHGYVSVSGEVEARSSVSVFPDVAGKVVNVKVSLGSSVRRGQVVGYVDPSAPGAYFKQSPVYAPISGSVVSVPLRSGTTVSTGTALCVIGDIDNLRVSVNVPERYVSVLKVGLKADVSVEAYPGVKFRATVSRVSPVVDPVSRTKQVVLTFDEKDGRVNAGMFAKVVLFTEDYSGCVVMPLDSLVQNGEERFAYVVRADSTVSRRKVTLGRSVDGMVQLVDGVKAGERVVVQGQTSLADGSAVLDIGAREAGNAGADKAEGAPDGKGDQKPDKASDRKNDRKNGRKTADKGGKADGGAAR